MTAFAQQESTICQLHHKEHTENCGYDETNPESVCAYISGCPECVLEQEKSTEPAKTAVDFSDYLDSTMPIIFQSTADIDLHDYFVGCGVDESITFTCSPEKVSFSDYSDGDLFNITLTATGDYEGSFDLEGEVRFVNPTVVPTSIAVYFLDYYTHDPVKGLVVSCVVTAGEKKSVIEDFTTTETGLYNARNKLPEGTSDIWVYGSEFLLTTHQNEDYPSQQFTVSWGGSNGSSWGKIEENIYIKSYRTVTATIKNSHGQPLTNATVKVGSRTLAHNGNGVYSGKCDFGEQSVTVSAPGYSSHSATITINDNNVTTEYSLTDNTFLVKDGNTALTSKSVLNISGTESKTLTTDVPLDNNAALTASVTNGNADGLGISVNGNNITITAKAAGEYKVKVTYTHGSNTESITFGVKVPKKQVRYPYTPILDPESVTYAIDKTTQEIRFNGADEDIIHNVTITASYANGNVINTQTFNNISGSTVTMQLSDTPVQGVVTYSFEFFSDSLEYVSGDKPGTISRTYMLSVPDVTISLDKNTYEYDGTNIKPEVKGLDKDKYSLEYGYCYDFNNFPNSYQPATDFTKPTEFAKVSNYQVKYYAVRAVGNEKNYYSSGFQPAGVAYYTVTKRNITLTADNQTIDFYETLDQSKVTIGGSGLASGETLTYTLSPQPDPTSNGGTIAIDNIKIKRGTKDVTQYYNITVQPGKYTVNKIDAQAITVAVPEVTYNASAQTPDIAVKFSYDRIIPKSYYEVACTNNTNAGTANYTITSGLWDGEITGTFKINPKPLVVSAQDASKVYGAPVENENLLYVYDTNELEGTDTLNGIKVSRAPGEDAGEYTITVSQENGSNPNYDITFKTGIFTIEPKPITLVAEDKAKTYGEADCELTYKLHEGSSLEFNDTLSNILIKRGTGEDVGEYTITIDQAAGENKNYNISFNYGKFTIKPKELTVNVTVKDKQYDGLADAEFEAELVGVIDSDAGKVMLDRSQVTAAFDSVLAADGIAVALTGDFDYTCTGTKKENYFITQPTGFTASIYNTYDAGEYTVSSADWTNQDVVITANSDYLLSLGYSDSSDWTETLTYSSEAASSDGNEFTFYVRNASTKAISLPEKVMMKIDKTPAEGNIEITGVKGWQELVSSITFGLFFKDTKVININATDALSGIRSIEYLESAQALTLDDLSDASFTPYPQGGVTVPLEDAKKFVYYAKITDNAGNITFISTDGSVYDTTLPKIEGIENGKVYYVTQKAIVSDANIDKITLNGTDTASPITLNGNTDCEYTITAVDKAGNMTTFKVTMKPISTIDDAIEDLTEGNVTSANKSDAEETKAQIEESLSSSEITEDEKALLENELKEAEALIEKIEETSAAANSSTITDTDNLTENNATVANYSDLLDAKAAIEKVLKDYSGNLTASEIKSLKADLSRINSALYSVGRVLDVMGLIGRLPDYAISVEDYKGELAQRIDEAYHAYHSLNEHEQSQIDIYDLIKLVNLQDPGAGSFVPGTRFPTEYTGGDPVTKPGGSVSSGNSGTSASTSGGYRFTKGQNSRWYYNSRKGLTFTVNGDIAKFSFITVDGKVVDRNNYTAASGSTVITLSNSFLKTLSLGNHSIKAYYVDGSTDTTAFTVLESSVIPFTGDDSNALIWGAAALVGFIVLIAAIKGGKKSKKSKKR